MVTENGRAPPQVFPSLWTPGFGTRWVSFLARGVAAGWLLYLKALHLVLTEGCSGSVHMLARDL